MIKAIFAMDEGGGIGKDGTLPWPKNDKDLRWFKTNTTNSTVVMGRNTWDDPFMPNPLPRRQNVVITSRGMNVYENTTTISITDARSWLSKNSHKNMFIIGGAKVLNTYWDMIDLFYVSIIHGDFNCDAFIDTHNIKSLESKKILQEYNYEGLTLRVIE
jgi:dihydrofolate reductase